MSVKELFLIVIAGQCLRSDSRVYKFQEAQGRQICLYGDVHRDGYGI